MNPNISLIEQTEGQMSLEQVQDETNGESSPIYDMNSKTNEIPDFVSFGEFVTLVWAIESNL